MTIYECGCTLVDEENELFCPTHCAPYIYIGESTEEYVNASRESLFQLLSYFEDEYGGL